MFDSKKFRLPYDQSYTIDQYFACDLPGRLIAPLKRLTWGSGGFMVNQLNTRHEPSERGLVAFVAYRGEACTQPAGWSSLMTGVMGHESCLGEVHLYTHPKARGHGIGQQLMNEMIALASLRGIGQLTGFPGGKFEGFFVKNGFVRNVKEGCFVRKLT